MSSPNDFYRQVSGQYDSMTRFAERMKPEEEVLGEWKRRFGFQSALDAGCGTGLHAVILARLGVRTTAADISPDMLELARQHAAEAGVDVSFVKADLARLDDQVKGQFDAVFCLGNSLPHLLGDEELLQAFHAFRNLLAPKGIVVVQILNYERVLSRQERIVGVNREAGDYFVRFYDFLENQLRFNVLWIAEQEGKLTHRLTSTLLRPYRLPEVESTLARAGLPRIDTYGDLRFSPFDPTSSANLVVVARQA